jgi:D-alanyl-D-alanine carboxypeptidase
MYCTITAGLLLSSVSIASLPCSDFDQTIGFDQITEVEKPRVAEVEKPKVQVASLDHSYVPLPPSQPKKSEIKIGTTTINLEPSNIKNMSLLVIQTPDNVLKTSVASEHASKFVCLLTKLVASGYPIKDIGGYNYRKIFGTNYLSLHAYGKALDVNQVRYNEVTVQQPKRTIEMAHECGLDSGAEWRTPDTGHFEVPTEGYGTRIARSDATTYGGILSYASSKIQQFWNWSVH